MCTANFVAAELRNGSVNSALEAWEWYLAAPRRMAGFEGIQNTSAKSENTDVVVLNRTAGPAPALPPLPPVERILGRFRDKPSFLIPFCQTGCGVPG